MEQKEVFDDFTCTAGMLRHYLLSKYGADLPLEAEDIPIIQILVKVSRQSRHHKKDNLDDLCGYANTIHMVKIEKERRAAIELEKAKASIPELLKLSEDELLQKLGEELVKVNKDPAPAMWSVHEALPERASYSIDHCRYDCCIPKGGLNASS